ncbi:DUF982 domain-containing protein [Brucella anthropi]|uniref:DUF982 domain-containing protein n=1 Tax=Brucella anthropi TaxID=529 RepID=UPI000F671842|nr:DUF982 domain-containing protein [Brucella anthropi]RRY08840.1 DUF982 domain-containing protein [Brucella anthropi]
MAWGKPVDVQLYGTGKYLIVTTTERAAESLLYEWPEDSRGKEYQDALQACLADLEGLPNTARNSFIKAAKASGLMIRKSLQ